jgi:hypothetical protein
MDKENLIQITTDVYRLTLLFPKKEPLRYKAREIADEVLDGYLRTKNLPKKPENCFKELLINLDILDCYFEIAKKQNWLSAFDILKVQENYANLKKELEELLRAETKEKTSLQEPGEVSLLESLSGPEEEALTRETSQVLRQKKIIEILKQKGKGQVWEFKKIFPEVTKRTLRRDFEHLLKLGLVKRIGERNNTYYQVSQNSN